MGGGSQREGLADMMFQNIIRPHRGKVRNRGDFDRDYSRQEGSLFSGSFNLRAREKRGNSFNWAIFIERSQQE